MDKYDLIPGQLVREGSFRESDFIQPDVLSEAEVLSTHSAEYWEKLRDQKLSAREERRLGFPQSPALTLRECTIAKGTWLACQAAMKHGVSLNVSGGTHHAFRDRGEGFCLLNDIAIAATLALHHGLAERILIIDLDVHQGNGTASLFNNEDRVFTFSMHGRDNYPLEKEHSDLDVELPTGLDDAGYLHTLDFHLAPLLDTFRPQLAFYLSGVDVLATDKYGKLKLSPEGCAARDRYVMQRMKQNNIPLAAAMGGGYSPRLNDIVEAHCNTFRIAGELWG